MPGLPLPLWYRELPQTGGATAVARAGGRLRGAPSVRVRGGARATWAAGGERQVERRLRGGGHASWSAGGPISGAQGGRGGARAVLRAGGRPQPLLGAYGGATASLRAGARLVAVVVERGGAISEASAGGSLGQLWTLRGGAAARWSAGGTRTILFVPVVVEPTGVELFVPLGLVVYEPRDRAADALVIGASDNEVGDATLDLTSPRTEVVYDQRREVLAGVGAESDPVGDERSAIMKRRDTTGG